MARIIVFTGGARSGKSARAEQYAQLQGSIVVYVATAEAGDTEMHQRIAIHRDRRPAHWQTLEVTHHVGLALRQLKAGTTVLLDCLTLLVSNTLLAHEENPELFIDEEIAELIAAAYEYDLTLIVVTNEVGMGLVPEYPLGRQYRDLLGRAAQRIAASADEVYFVVAGIPVELNQLAAPWSKIAKKE